MVTDYPRLCETVILFCTERYILFWSLANLHNPNCLDVLNHLNNTKLCSCNLSVQNNVTTINILKTITKSTSNKCQFYFSPETI